MEETSFQRAEMFGRWPEVWKMSGSATVGNEGLYAIVIIVGFQLRRRI
jgi:hypothetical protein